MKNPELQALMNMSLEHSVAELIAKRFDTDLTHEDRVARLGASAAPIIREALPISDSLRGRAIDPADAFLQGVTFSEMNRQEKSEREQFAADMETRTKPIGLKAWALGSAAVLFTGGKFIKPSWAENREHHTQ